MQLDGKACGVCGKPAATFFVNGYRCEEHKGQVSPSDAILTDNTILVIPGLHAKKLGEPFIASEIIMISTAEEPFSSNLAAPNTVEKDK